MDRLSAPEGRVVGCLVEKQLATPQQYPLTLNALVAACNQSSNREPVTAYAEAEVLGALDGLKEARLVRFVLPSHGRSVVRYRHVLNEALGIDGPQLAVLSTLLLRGPQTLGELRTRTERMADLGSLGAVEHELELLAGAVEPMVARADRRPGQKEERWRQLLAEPEPEPVLQVGVAPAAGAVTAVGASHQGGELETVTTELAELRSEVAALRAAVAELRDALGG